MGLNIKNERVHRLAREAARVTGRTQTGAIEEALVKLLREYDVDPDQARPGPVVDRVLAIAAQWQADPGRGHLRAEDLYDEATGLPR